MQINSLKLFRMEIKVGEAFGCLKSKEIGFAFLRRPNRSREEFIRVWSEHRDGGIVRLILSWRCTLAALVTSHPAFRPALRRQRHRSLHFQRSQTLLQALVGDLRQNVLSTTRRDDVVEAEVHSERDELVVVLRLTPNVLHGHRFGEAERLVRKSDRSWTIAADQKLLHQLRRKNH